MHQPSDSRSALATYRKEIMAGTPLPPSESALLKLWQETLSAPGAAADENFFECGGTSLLAARLAARISTQFGCPIHAADILAHPSVRQLLAKLASGGAPQDRSAADQRAAMQRRAYAVSRAAR